jgi:hypothetical protein
MNHTIGLAQAINRRHFLQAACGGLGAAALGMVGDAFAAPAPTATGGLPGLPHFAPKAKRIIFLHQSGAPSQLETFDYKPGLKDIHGTELPDSIRMGQRLTGMTSKQTNFPVLASKFSFAQYGKNGAWVSELLPHTAKIVDDICIVRTVHTEAINHDPAITFCQTGSQLAGRPSMGAWVAYGLGTMNRDLPTFMVLVSRGTGRSADQPLYDRLWGAGMLPGQYQGVKLRSGNEPVLYISDPAGCSHTTRREMLDLVGALNMKHHEVKGDPEILARIEQYELAFRMQASVPDLTDITNEPQSVLDAYGPDVMKPGTYARNCLLARRMIERDVRFVQLYHMGWDHHDNLPDHLTKQCHDTDQPSAALVNDLKQRGLLDDTLVVWGGEFGRTVYSQGKATETTYGRDHHPRCFSIWMAGGGVKPGLVYGTTDDFSYNIVQDPVHISDLHATILNQLGIDHRLLSVKYQGLDVRLTGVEDRKVVKALLA